MIELEHFDHTLQFHLRNTAVLVTRLFDRLERRLIRSAMRLSRRLEESM